MAKTATHNSKKSAPKAHSSSAARSAGNISFPVVGIGASAGGLEALTQLLGGLPSHPGLALVLVQHLDPTHESALTLILARATSMKVTEARNHMPLAPDSVFVIPPNKKMGLQDGRLQISPREQTSGILAVDHFFRKLAECEGNRAIGVVLSGNGSDGTQGCLAIKAAGGITFAQDEKTCKYPGMPGSAITAGCVDFVLPPDRIGRELARLAGHSYVAPAEEPEPKQGPTDERAFEQVLLLLRQRMHVDFTQYKHTTLRRRIHRRMALQKLESLKDYADYLRSYPPESKQLYNDILIHVTGFFRDPSVHQFLRKKVFPRMVKNKAPEDPVRIWVPGCSTGEEVYSLAISMIEFLAEQKSNHPLQIFATDIHDVALEKARAGLYPESIQSDVSTERLRRFFLKSDGNYRINKSVRELCIFARQNVVTDPPFSNIDLISCRNLLIYLGPALQRKVLPLFHYALRPEAFLLLGGSETVGGFADLFALMDKKAKVYVKKGAHIRPVVTFGSGIPEVPAPGPHEPAPQPPAAGLYDVQRQADRILLTHFSPSGVLINRQMEVLQFRGHTGPYLEHPRGEANLNLLKMAREGLSLVLRTAVTRAFKQGSRVVHHGARARQNGEMLEVTIEVIPFVAPPATDQFCLVLFQPAGSVPKPAPAPKSARHKGPEPLDSAPAELDRLEQELAATRESLQAVIEEQEAGNEELRSANEEIMSSNEELQSTNEELETAKEELQSTNEELTTLNDELESRNIELETLNNDLDNLLASANIPIVILGHDLRIRRFTGRAERAFSLIPADIGRPITDINLPFEMADLGKQVLEVLDSLTMKELEVKSKEGQWWQVRIRPYKTTENKIDGAVITVMDINELKANVQSANQGQAFAEAVLNAVRQPMMALDKQQVVQFVNTAFCDAFQIDAGQVLHRRVYDLGEGRWNIPALHNLLEEVLPRDGSAANFELQHDLLGRGEQRLRLSARRVGYGDGQEQLTLLAIEPAGAGGAAERGGVGA